MGYKIQNVLENAHKKVNENFSEYINYLHVMGNNYKYSAMEQLNIFFIRPEAVACAEYDFWKENFNRVVERNQKGIPVYSIRNGKRNVRYILTLHRQYLWIRETMKNLNYGNLITELIKMFLKE